MAGSQDYLDDPRNDALIAYVNGDFVPAHSASVSVFDAGFGLGDGIWEGLRLHRGRLLFLEAHLDRLFESARTIRIEIGLSKAALAAQLQRLCLENEMVESAHLRLMVTRGRKRTINQDPRFAPGPATIVITAEHKQARAIEPGGGLVLNTVSIRTTGPEMFDMRLNSHSRLNLIRALLEAIDAGGDEAVMLDPHDHVASCNATNLFWVRDGELFTSGDRYCFNGITRSNVITACRKGIAPLRQGNFPIDSLRMADEVFVTGTMGGVTPVRAIDGRDLPGEGGVMTKHIANAYEAMKDADAAQVHA